MTPSRKKKSKISKGPPAGTVNNLHKRLESEQISNDISLFKKSGGRIEKLGVTKLLQKITDKDTPTAPVFSSNSTRADK